ncbi:MAG TPA: helix-turn-helix domain-containing protein [Streptosporangiaceae bacterium]|jgi:hypothetical protein
MGSWGFLSNHGRVLLFLAHDPGMRLRDIAASLGITERTAFGIVTDLTGAGYISKRKDGRRNHYQIHAHQPLPEPTSRERTIGEFLALLAGPAAAADLGQPPREEGHR